MTQENAFPPFVGWMLWNIVLHEHRQCGAPWPEGIFEDQPEAVRAAWERAATALQQRATSLGRLV